MLCIMPGIKGVCLTKKIAFHETFTPIGEYKDGNMRNGMRVLQAECVRDCVYIPSSY